MKKALLSMISLVFFIVSSAFAGVEINIFGDDGITENIVITSLANKDSNWSCYKIKNDTPDPIKLSGVQFETSYPNAFVFPIEMENDNTIFASSTFTTNIKNLKVDGSIGKVIVSASNSPGIPLAAGASAIIGWVRWDPSNMHIDTRYDISVRATVYDETDKKTYKIEDTAQIYCAVAKGDASFSGKVTAYDVSKIAERAGGFVNSPLTQLEFDVMDLNADGIIDATDVFHALKTAADPAYVPPAEVSGHHPAPPITSAFSDFSKKNVGDLSAKCSFRLTPLEFVSEGIYRTFLVVDGLPQKSLGIDIDFAKSKNVQVDIKPIGVIEKTEKDWAEKTTSARLVFASLEPLAQAGHVAEIQLRTSDGRLPEFGIQDIVINERRPVGKDEEANLVRWETQKILTPPTTILQNYPNPFNPETWIPYQLAEQADVTIAIFNSNGQMVRSLSLGNKNPGFYLSQIQAAHWDGKNEVGEIVSSGIYFYSIKTGNAKPVTKKMVVKK